jgi:hypothetical protein
MALNYYPIPKLDQTINELSQVMKLFLQPSDFEGFLNELNKHLEYLKSEHSAFF